MACMVTKLEKDAVNVFNMFIVCEYAICFGYLKTFSSFWCRQLLVLLLQCGAAEFCVSLYHIKKDLEPSSLLGCFIVVLWEQ